MLKPSNKKEPIYLNTRDNFFSHDDAANDDEEMYYIFKKTSKEEQIDRMDPNITEEIKANIKREMSNDSINNNECCSCIIL